MIKSEYQVIFNEKSVSPADAERFRNTWFETIAGAAGYIAKIIIIDDLEDYPWIKCLDHLKRINRYRRRVGQRPLNFNDEHIAELALTSKR